jgi:hypothetical protein
LGFDFAASLLSGNTESIFAIAQVQPLDLSYCESAFEYPQKKRPEGKRQKLIAFFQPLENTRIKRSPPLNASNPGLTLVPRRIGWVTKEFRYLFR